LHSIVQSRCKKKKRTLATFVDFSKAFDGVNRSMLLHKLLSCGIDGKFYHAIKSIYNRTVACVDLNGVMGDDFETLCGVRQGDNLSPTLFSAFINDLATRLKESGLGVQMGDHKVPILLYADDIVLLAEDQTSMQRMLDILDDWCKT